jgi:hypothetical protein
VISCTFIMDVRLKMGSDGTIAFENDLCTLLRQNNRTLNLARFQHCVIPLDCGARLGMALQGNKRVTEIIGINIAPLFPNVGDNASYDDTKAELLIKFIRQSKTLRSLSFSGRIGINNQKLPLPFFAAVAQNSCIESVYIDIKIPCNALCQLLHITSSLKSLNVRLLDESTDEARMGDTTKSCISMETLIVGRAVTTDVVKCMLRQVGAPPFD